MCSCHCCCCCCCDRSVCQQSCRCLPTSTGSSSGPAVNSAAVVVAPLALAVLACCCHRSLPRLRLLFLPTGGYTLNLIYILLRRSCVMCLIFYFVSSSSVGPPGSLLWYGIKYQEFGNSVMEYLSRRHTKDKHRKAIPFVWPEVVNLQKLFLRKPTNVVYARRRVAIS